MLLIAITQAEPLLGAAPHSGFCIYWSLDVPEQHGTGRRLMR